MFICDYLQKYFRDLNQKLFPILSIAETSDEFYKMFTDETTGFAFIAYYSDMIVGSEYKSDSKMSFFPGWSCLLWTVW